MLCAPDTGQAYALHIQASMERVTMAHQAWQPPIGCTIVAQYKTLFLARITLQTSTRTNARSRTVTVALSFYMRRGIELASRGSKDMEDLFLLVLVSLVCRDGWLGVEAAEVPIPKGLRRDLDHRYRRQAMRGAMPPMNEAHAEREGVFDPTFLAAMFQASGFLPSVGSSMMNNGFASLCTYPYLYYYYQYCVGMGGAGMNSLQPDILPYSVGSNSPGLLPSASNNYPLYGTSNGMDGLGPYTTNINSQPFMNPYAFSPGSSPSEPSPRNPDRNRERPQPVQPSPNPSTSFNSRANHVPRGSPMLINTPIMGFIPPAFVNVPMRFPVARPSPRGTPFRIPPSVLFAKMFGPLLEERGPDVVSTKTLNSNTTVTTVIVEVGPNYGDVNAASVSIDSPIIEIVDNLPLPPVIDVTLGPDTKQDKKHWTKMVTRLNQKGSLVKSEKEFERFLIDAFDILLSAENSSVSFPKENSTTALTVIMEAVTSSLKTKDSVCVKQYFCQAGKQLLREGGHFDPGVKVLQAIRPSISNFLETRIPDAEVQLSLAMEESATSRSCDALKLC